MSIEAIEQGQPKRIGPTRREIGPDPAGSDASLIPMPLKPEIRETADPTDTAVIASAIERWLENSYVERPGDEPTISVPTLTDEILASTQRPSAAQQTPDEQARNTAIKHIIAGADTFTNYDQRIAEPGSAYRAIAGFLEITRSRGDSAQFAAQRRAALALLDLAAAIYTERSRALLFIVSDIEINNDKEPMLDTLKGTEEQEDALSAITEIAESFTAFALATAESRKPPEAPPTPEAPKPATRRRSSPPRRPPTGGNTRRG